MKKYIKSATDAKSYDELLALTDRKLSNAIGRMEVTDPEILRKLAEHPSHLVRAEVAWNPNTPQDVVIALASDTNSVVRGCAALNENLPIEELWRIAKLNSSTRNYFQKTRLIERQDVPDEILEYLIENDKDPDVVYLAKRRLETGKYYAERREDGHFYNVF